MRRSRVTTVAALAATLLSSSSAMAQKKERPWYEWLRVRGYTQVRYNRAFASNAGLRSTQGDKSIGAAGGISLRRARLVFSGESRAFGFYIQPDFASAVDGSLDVAMLRDAYGDVFLDKRKELRVRIGQQKVPYGWELLQSSSNRLPLDRSDGMNSAFVNERDIGAFFMFETAAVWKRFRRLVDSGLKGSGDYGMVTAGFSNGQPLNSREKNLNKHFFARVAVPFDVGSQTIEIAGGGYTGLFVPSVSEGIAARRDYRDLRFHGTFVLYPKPVGLQVEYNAGVGPERHGDAIVERPLDGGYAMTMVRIATGFGHVTPYLRVHRYDGGKKFETDAPRHEVRELDVGVEWQLHEWLELTTEMMATDRTVDGNRQEGRLFRVQVQFNY